MAHDKASAEEIAQAIFLPVSKTRRLLEGIEGKGLATHSPERPRRYIATPPELAAELFLSRRKADLELARLSLLNMKRFKSSVQGSQEQPVEIITERSMLNQILSHLAQSAKSEILVFQRGPILFSSFNEGQKEQTNVSIRTISDATFLDHPGGLAFIRRDVEAGEQARFMRTLPCKMTIVDRRVAIISLSSTDPGGTRLLIRTSGLLEALHLLFELTWDHSTPIDSNGERGSEQTNGAFFVDAERLINLMSMGLNDKTIAHELGASASTVTRRIAGLMQSFGTRSRFQMGWRAALDAFPDRLSGLEKLADEATPSRKSRYSGRARR